MFFKNELKKRIKNEKGLTLIELLAVIVILAIVAAIAIPAIGNIIDNSRTKAVISDAQNAMSGANIYFTDEPTQTVFTNTGTATAEFTDYLESTGKITKITVTKTSPNNTISFTATIKGKSYDIPAVTLNELNAATVKKGVLTLKGTTYNGQIGRAHV